MPSKRDQVRDVIQTRVRESVLLHTAGMNDRQKSEVLRQMASDISITVAHHLTEEYRFLELADIFEWKRQRVRR